MSKRNPGAEELVQLLQAELVGWNEGALKVTSDSPYKADFWLLHLSRCARWRQAGGR